jgi:hypothetical protein
MQSKLINFEIVLLIASKNKSLMRFIVLISLDQSDQCLKKKLVIFEKKTDCVSREDKKMKDKVGAI